MKSRLVKFAVATVVVLVLAALIASIYLLRWDVLNPLRRGTVTVDNLEREYFVHVPKNLHAKAGVVVVLHGSGMTAKLMQVFSGHEFDEAADAHGDFVVVYPQGYEKGWNDCRVHSTAYSKLHQLDDLGFLDHMLQQLATEYDLNPAHRDVVGFSNGAQLAFKLASERPDLFAAYAAISANWPVADNNDCTAGHTPVSLLLMNGTADPINPFEGGDVKLPDGRNFGAVMGTEGTWQHWLTLLDPVPVQVVTPVPRAGSDDDTSATITRAVDDAHHVQLALVRIQDGGHVVPNANFRLWPRGTFGKQSHDVDAPPLIVDFFVRAHGL
jgi:polyhydroxybutyrate depolymerase